METWIEGDFVSIGRCSSFCIPVNWSRWWIRWCLSFVGEYGAEVYRLKSLVPDDDENYYTAVRSIEEMILPPTQPQLWSNEWNKSAPFLIEINSSFFCQAGWVSWKPSRAQDCFSNSWAALIIASFSHCVRDKITSLSLGYKCNFSIQNTVRFDGDDDTIMGAWYGGFGGLYLTLET